MTALKLRSFQTVLAALAIFCALRGSFSVSAAGTNNFLVKFSNFGLNPATVRSVTVAPVSWAVNANGFLVADPKTISVAAYPAMTNGSVTFSNYLTGYPYTITLATGFTTYTTNFFVQETDTNTPFNIAERIGWAFKKDAFWYAATITTNVTVTTNSGGVTPIAAGTGITITPSGGTNIISVYTAPTISSFANNQVSVENGATVSSTILTWTLAGGSITSQSVNQGIGSLSTALRTVTDSASYTTARTYTLTIADSQTTNTASTSVNFYNKIYWGASSNTSLNDAQVIALSSAFATSRSLTQSIDGAGGYMYVAYPASFGAATFTVGGFADTGWTLVTRAFVNASGASSSYNIYRHTTATVVPFVVVVQ